MLQGRKPPHLLYISTLRSIEIPPIRSWLYLFSAFQTICGSMSRTLSGLSFQLAQAADSSPALRLHPLTYI